MQNWSIFLQNRAFERFESFPCFGRLLWHFCYIHQDFKNWKKIPTTRFCFTKKPKIWTCLEVLLFRSHSTVFCNLYQFLKNWKKLRKRISNSKKNPKIERFEKSYFFWTISNSILLPLAICKEIMFFYWKIQLFSKTRQTLHVLRNFTVSVAF